MEDILCPSCGKPNIAGMETCWNCGARLQPSDSNAPAGSDSNTPDWLAGLRDETDDNQQQPEISLPAGESPAEAGDIPDWLAGLRPADNSAAQDEAPQDDWLSGLAGGNSASADGTLDWLKGEAEQPAAGDDWMGGLRDTDQPTPSAEEILQPLDAVQPQDSNEDDWIKNLSAWQTTPESDLPAEKASEPAFNWSDLAETPAEDAAQLQNEPVFGEPSADEGAEQSAEPADLPDWLAGSPAALENEESAPAEPASTFTSWLREQPAENDEESAAAESSQPFADLPDWLNEQPAETAAQPDAVESALPFADLPDWLNEIPAAAGEPASEPEPPAPLLPFIGSLEDQPAPEAAETPGAAPFTLNDDEQPAAEQIGETPEWLKAFSANLQPEETEPPALDAGQAIEESIAPFEGGTTGYSGSDLPDWLNVDEPLPSAFTEVSEESESDALETAQLPGWLQAMRPVESAIDKNFAQPQPDEITERAGPLAGLVGALPGENLVTQYQKLPPYSARLQVSERQRLNANLIDEMLAEDTRARPARPERSHLPQRIVRAVIALVFLLTLLFPLVGGTQIMPMPDLYPPETVAFHGLVEQLLAGAPVLLAVDYEPGLSGEMQLASSAVVDHLMSRNARLAVVSTMPVGPVLADSLLREVHAARGEYALGELAVNLGFLPGGTAGLQEFASRPQAALPYTHDGKRMAWSQPALAGVGSLNQFSLVVVLTENAETARAWVEQVQPALENVPLLFVSSAQTAPFLQPYLDSGQVQAMVSGMAGGSMYAQITGQPNQGRAYWDAYQFGIFLAVLLVLLGGLIALLAPVFKRRPARKGN